LNDPNAWGCSLIEEEQPKEMKNRALKLLESFSMSSSQKGISAKLLERRLQIVWGPPVNIMHFCFLVALVVIRLINSIYCVLTGFR